MAAPPPHAVPVSPDSLITVKVMIDGTNRRFKLALRDLGAHVLPQKLRFLLAVPPDAHVVFERFSDSAGSYVALDSDNPAVYKQLYRAAKAKLKLRIRATVTQRPAIEGPDPNIMQLQKEQRSQPLRLPTPPKSSPASRHSYLDTVLSTSREEEDLGRCPERTTPITMSCLVPKCQTVITSVDNCMDDMLATSMKHEQAQDAKKVMSSKTNSRYGGLRSGQYLSGGAFCIDCNHCGKPISDEHYHCGICDKGDYDLCPSCIASDVTCEGPGHWLIKRQIQDGLLVSSVTETLAPKKWQEQKGPDKEKDSATITGHALRTCNACTNEVAGQELVTCTHCANYDLCMKCLSLSNHGHHPAHRFQPVSADTSNISSHILSLCEPGRNLFHAAVCDGCNKRIFGVRHKCLSCPDWDYCSTCVLSASEIHPGHRFAALYEEIADIDLGEEIHFGIYCDGPRCASKPHNQHIRGTRYKCAVCPDTDFCANCEALPSLRHNRTHPLIKFRMPVRHVSVTTLGEKPNGQSMPQMGDRPSARNAATETIPAINPISTTSQVQTVAEVKPVEEAAAEKQAEGSESKKLAPELQAWFECDSTPDGSILTPDRLFTQSWKMRNPGPHAWPAGCAVCFTGGDHMLNVDAKNPSSVTAMVAATKSTASDGSLEPGQSTVFTVLLKSPEREGRAISYWRLKTPDGIPFGHKLWVDITVAGAATPVVPPTKIEEADAAQQEVKGEEVKLEAKSIGGKGKSVTPAEANSDGDKVEEVKSEESSTMIFPTLDKESPVSSMHDLAAAAAQAKVKSEDEELVEELESVGFEDDGETEDDFLTDEEYDILDASDEDLLVEAPKTSLK